MIDDSLTELVKCCLAKEFGAVSLDEEITGLDKALDGRGADFLLFERSVVLELETFQDPRIKRLEDIASTMKDPPESPRGLSRDQRMAKFNELVVPHLRQYYRTLR